jgi:predicted unusual protein kinase regulating ubiquinone biosynthesis (AarF/ABC1/UbiB family)
MNHGSRLRLGWTVGQLAGRRLLGRSESARDAELGALLSRQLDQMKGLGMKLGQIMSYMDVPLPASVQAELALLQSGMLGLGPSETRAALEAALGVGWQERFDAFDLEPISAASIGQVHRATYQGRQIALKLRYPEVARDFEKDTGVLDKVAGVASLASSVDGGALVDELAGRLAEECDYVREARSQTAFRRAFAAAAGLEIPEVIAALSTHSTLATSWSQGKAFAIARDFEQHARDRIAEHLASFSYQSLLVLAAIQADPHPGNFLFEQDGTVTCLDFGCVRSFEISFVELLRELIVAIDRNDHAGFREAVIALGIAPRPDKFDFDHHFAMMAHLHRPLLCPQFTFERGFVQQGLAYNGPRSPNARTMALPPAYLWVMRLQWGLWSLLTKLGASVSLRPLWEQLAHTPVSPLAFPALPACPAP